MRDIVLSKMLRIAAGFMLAAALYLAYVQNGAAQQACTVNFDSDVTVRLSAKGRPEPIMTETKPVATIPIQVKGSTVTLRGQDLPLVTLEKLGEIEILGQKISPKIDIKGIPNTVFTGTYDAATGKIEIPNLRLSMRVYHRALGELGLTNLDGLTLTTEAIGPFKGNREPLSAQGQRLNEADKSLALVFGRVLPTGFKGAEVLNFVIGGGSLTSEFEGKVDKSIKDLPAECR